MPDKQLANEILGDDVKLNKVDPEQQKATFRAWIEPILAVVVVLLGIAVGVLLVLVLDLRDKESASSDERARGSAGVCRLLNGLGLDPLADPNGRCGDPEVLRYWEQFQNERTQAAVTSHDILTVICGNAESLGDLPAPCAALDQDE